jgi:uncharacterized protein YdaU (DUF1376 family)
MAEFPALPLWTDAYLGDTRHLSQAEHGAYLLLLITAWRTAGCCLPDDDGLLSRYAGCKDPRTWRRQKPVVMAFWELRGGRWYQKRLTTERRYVAELARKRAEAGREGAEARWRNGDETLARYDGKIPDTVNGKIPERSPADREPNALKTDETAQERPGRAQLSAGAVAFEIRVNPVMVPGKLRVFNGIQVPDVLRLSIIITAPQFCTI